MNTINIFDWDDNILFMPTKVYLEQWIYNGWFHREVSTEDFKFYRDKPMFRMTPDSFKDFKDNDKFTEEVQIAINNYKSTGPSFNDFKGVLIEGKKFAIITARGHSRKTIMNGIMLLINEKFTELEINEMVDNVGDILSYLRNQYTYAVDSPDFKKEFFDNKDNNLKWGEYSNKTNLKKVIALEEYIKIRTSEIGSDEKLKIFFSDDDINNIKVIHNYLKSFKISHSNASFIIYDTSTGAKKEITS